MPEKSSLLEDQAVGRHILECLAIVIPPGLLALVELFHARGHGEAVYEVLKTQVDRWLIVHYFQLVLFPLTAWSVYQLTAELKGHYQRLLAIGLAVFGVGYAAADSIAGIGTGLLVKKTYQDASIPGAPQEFEAYADLIIQEYFHAPFVGNLMLAVKGAAILGFVITMFRLHKLGHKLLPILMLAGACWGVTRTHAPPYGPITYSFVFIAALSVVFASRRKTTIHVER